MEQYSSVHGLLLCERSNLSLGTSMATTYGTKAGSRPSLSCLRPTIHIARASGDHCGRREPKGTCRMPLYILRALRSLRGILADMDRDQRRTALRELSPLVRAELLSFMEQARSAPAWDSCMASCVVPTIHFAAGALPTAEAASGTVRIDAKPCIAKRSQAHLRPPKLRKATHQGAKRSVIASRASLGVKKIRPGVFQASVCFERFLMKSPATSSFELALKYRSILRRVRDSVRLSSCTSIDTQDKKEHIQRPFGDRLREAMAHILATEESYSSGDCCKSFTFATYVSANSWVGKVESKYTASLEQALTWRERLGVARQQGWLTFRSTWIALLLEGSTSRLADAKHSGDAEVAAEAFVDAAWQRRSSCRKRLEERTRKRDRRHRALELSHARRQAAHIQKCRALHAAHLAAHAKSLERRFRQLAAQVEQVLIRKCQTSSRISRKRAGDTCSRSHAKTLRGVCPSTAELSDSMCQKNKDKV